MRRVSAGRQRGHLHDARLAIGSVAAGFFTLNARLSVTLVFQRFPRFDRLLKPRDAILGSALAGRLLPIRLIIVVVLTHLGDALAGDLQVIGKCRLWRKELLPALTRMSMP